MSSFPQNIADAIQARLATLMTDHEVFARNLRMSDQNLSVGILTDMWNPDEDSREIGGNPQGEPVLSRYSIKVQNLVLSLDEESGRELFTTNAKIVRAILARDTTLHDTLRALSEDLLSVREQVKRLGINRQRFQVGALNGTWTFLATTDLWVETETTHL